MAVAKGSNFERDMVKELSLWISHGKRVDVFMRNRVRVTEATPNCERQLGDLTSNDLLGIYYTTMFVTECKTGYSKTRKGTRVKNIPWDTLDILDSTKKEENNVLFQFWEQVRTDAELCGKKPILIFKRDFHVPCACINREVYQLISDYCGYFNHNHIDLKISGIQSDFLRIIRLETFLRWFNPDIIELMYKEKGIRKDSY